MKKQSLLITMLLMIATSMAFVSCSEDETSGNPLAGTIWSVDEGYASGSGSYTRYIEFVNESKVKVWETTLWGGTYTGTYTISGNNITFSNLRDDNYKFINGTYYGNSLKVYLQYDRFGTTSSSTVTRIYKK